MPSNVRLLHRHRRSNTILTLHTAALERVPEIKPQDVQEVFFGNVLSAK